MIYPKITIPKAAEAAFADLMAYGVPFGFYKVLKGAVLEIHSRDDNGRSVHAIPVAESELGTLSVEVVQGIVAAGGEVEDYWVGVEIEDPSLDSPWSYEDEEGDTVYYSWEDAPQTFSFVENVDGNYMAELNIKKASEWPSGVTLLNKAEYKALMVQNESL